MYINYLGLSLNSVKKHSVQKIYDIKTNKIKKNDFSETIISSFDFSQNSYRYLSTYQSTCTSEKIMSIFLDRIILRGWASS